MRLYTLLGEDTPKVQRPFARTGATTRAGDFVGDFVGAFSSPLLLLLTALVRMGCHDGMLALSVAAVALRFSEAVLGLLWRCGAYAGV